jgi:hypothetical protein
MWLAWVLSLVLSMEFDVSILLARYAFVDCLPLLESKLTYKKYCMRYSRCFACLVAKYPSIYQLKLQIRDVVHIWKSWSKVRQFLQTACFYQFS